MKESFLILRANSFTRFQLSNWHNIACEYKSVWSFSLELSSMLCVSSLV